MDSFNEYPNWLKDKLVSVLAIPTNQRVSGVARAAARSVWDGLSAKERLQYLIVLQEQILKESKIVLCACADVIKETKL